MEKRDDRDRLDDFLVWQPLLFNMVGYVYLSLDILWTRFQLGYMFFEPQFYTYIYNMFLGLSLLMICYKKTKIFDLLNLTLTYFYPFAVEVFNTSRAYEITKSDEKNIPVESVTVSDFLKNIEINQIAGLVFFFYAVHLRSNCLEILRGNPGKMPLVESPFDLIYDTHPSEGEISKFKIRCVVLVFISITILKACIEAYLIVLTIERPDPFMFVFAVANDIFIVTSILLFYRFRSINFNVFNVICSYSWFFQIFLFGLYVKICQMHSLKQSEANLVISFVIMIIFILGSLFVWANYTRLLLLEDCGYLASVRRLETLAKFWKTSDTSTNFDADKQVASNKIHYDESI